MMVEIVRFDGDWVALVKVQNDWTGNYITSVRQVRGEYGEEFIRYDWRRVNVDKAVEMARREENKRSIFEFIDSLNDVAVPESMPKDMGNRTIVILKKKN